LKKTKSNYDIKYINHYKNEIINKTDKIKVVYTDLDSTLLNDKGCIIQDAQEEYFFDALKQIQKCLQRGIDIVMVSGRGGFQLKYNAQLLNLKNYIAELGSELIYDLGKEVYTTFNKEEYSYHFPLLGEDFKKVVEVLKREFPSKIECKPEWNKNRSTNIVMVGEVDTGKANLILEKNGFSGAILANNGPTSLFSTGLEIKKHYILNLMPKGVDKSTGVKLDKKIRDFKKEECIALGDSVEDLKMADEVELFFLMNNDIFEEEDVLSQLYKYDNVYVTTEKMNRGWAEVLSIIFD